MSDKTKQYRINMPHYRQGLYVPAGTVIEVDASEKPSVTWEPLAKPVEGAMLLPPLPTPEKLAAANAAASRSPHAAVTPVAAPVKGRANDRDIA